MAMAMTMVMDSVHVWKYSEFAHVRTIPCRIIEQWQSSGWINTGCTACEFGNDVYIFPSVLGPKWDLGLIQFDIEGTGADGALVLLASIA